jgi:hypothetical protein
VEVADALFNEPILLGFNIQINVAPVIAPYNKAPRKNEAGIPAIVSRTGKESNNAINNLLRSYFIGIKKLSSH